MNDTGFFPKFGRCESPMNGDVHHCHVMILFRRVQDGFKILPPTLEAKHVTPKLLEEPMKCHSEKKSSDSISFGGKGMVEGQHLLL